MSDTVGYRPATGEIPTNPGVYRFRDADGRILYVGKAKNLRARLVNYFQPLPNLHERTRRMVTTAVGVEWTVVASEYEALQLEFTWIKEYNPPFNVQFRDDKSYPYLAVTMGERIPRVFITRKKNIKNARYFGPYTKVWAIRETLDLMLKAFPMRSCTDGVYRRAEATGRPCLLAHIGKCSAPCVGWVTPEEHRAIAERLVSFMGGADTEFLTELSGRMREAAAEQDYEAAARHRDALAALEAVLEKTSVVLGEGVDADVFGIADDELAAAVQHFIVRGGRIRGVHGWIVDKELDVDLAGLVETVLHHAYSGESAPPREVLVPALPEDALDLERWLGERRAASAGRGGRVDLRVPRRGDKAALAKTANLNAAGVLARYKTKRTSDFVARSQALAQLQEALGMDLAPLRMECYDVSHLSGTNIVASMVVFEDGLARKDLYRRFSIASSSDDTDSIRQVLTRRLARLGEEPDATRQQAADPTEPEAVVVAPERTARRFAYRPQLLVVDGGPPQVQAAAEALAEAGVHDIALCGIAKRLEELWLPGSDYPVILPRDSEALFLIQRIRDEAHRFAITYQRARRRRDIHTVLGEIPGVGPTRARRLLRHFGSVARLRAADTEAIRAVEGIGDELAATIRDHLHETAPDRLKADRSRPGAANGQ